MFDFLRNNHALSTAAAPFDDAFLPATHMGPDSPSPANACCLFCCCCLINRMHTKRCQLWLAFSLLAAPPAAWGLSSPARTAPRGPSERAGSSALERHATPASSPSPFNVTPLSTHLWPHRAFLAALASSLALVFGLLVSVASRWEAGLQGGSFRLWLLGLQRPGSIAAVHSPSCPWACGVPPSLLLWQLGPLSLSHGKPTPPLKKKSNRCVLYPTQHVEA